jgi:hypothetical protein
VAKEERRRLAKEAAETGKAEARKAEVQKQLERARKLLLEAQIEEVKRISFQAQDLSNAAALNAAALRESARRDLVRVLRETHDTEVATVAWDLLDQTGTDKKRLTLSTLPPLSSAVVNGDKAEVDRLLKRRAQLATHSLNGHSALHWAVEAGSLEMAKLLLDAGANVNAFAVGGMTPLHRASAMGYRTLVDLLLDRGADINIVSIGGYTPLHHAAANGHVDVIRTLIARGASLAAKTNSRAAEKYMSPRELAVARGHPAAWAALDGAASSP